MPNVSQSVPASFIVETIGVILVLVAIGIVGVKKGKKRDEKN